MNGFAQPEGIDAADHVVATYWMRLAPGADIEQVAHGLAEMQSTGTWVALPGETERIRERHGARITAMWQMPDHEVENPGGDGGRGDPDRSGGRGLSDRDVPDGRDWIIRIAYPSHNIGSQIPLLLATTMGEGASTGPLRLLDLDLPRSFTDGFVGPRFGIEGVRSLLGVTARPLLVTMMKPALGLTPTESAATFRELARGGVDAVKDDELLVEQPWSSIVDRVRAHEHEATTIFQSTGHRTLYFVNITDRPDRMVANAHRAIEAGASGLMVDLIAVGTAAVAMLAEDPAIAVPILGHLAFAGAIYASPTSGVSSHLVLGKLPRLAGADLMVYPGPYGSLSFLRSKHLRVARSLTGAFHHIRPALPVPGGGFHAGMVPQLFADLGPDHAIGAGGAVHGHPLGAAAGAAAIRQAIDACVAGEPLADAAQRHPELAASLERWPELEREP